MFTGIVQKVGTVTRFVESDSYDLTTDNPYARDAPEDPIQLGESIAVSGVCLTVTEFTPSHVSFNVAPETLARTSMRRLSTGSKVNLERSLRMGDRLSGHWVQGHADGTAKLIGVTQVARGYFDLVLELSNPALLRYCVKKGSISIEGISLTIHELQGNRLQFQIIPHTWKQTNLVDLKNGDLVNIEVDLVAKYIERFQTINQT